MVGIGCPNFRQSVLGCTKALAAQWFFLSIFRYVQHQHEISCLHVERKNPFSLAFREFQVQLLIYKNRCSHFGSS